MKTLILTMIFNRLDREYVDLNAGKASPEETEDVENTAEAEEAEADEDTPDADTHEDEAD